MSAPSAGKANQGQGRRRYWPTKKAPSSQTSARTLGEWTPQDLDDSISSLTKTNFTLLSSYNSNFSPQHSLPTGSLVVPGCPPVWDPPTLPISLSPDTELDFPEQTPLRNVRPLLMALLTVQPSFDLNQIDIITDRFNLRKLLDFASGKSHRPFWICIEIINNSALFTTLEPHAKKISGGQQEGYGHQFEGAFTKLSEAVQGTTQHCRMVTYGFGGLNLLVRFEADGALSSDIESIPDAENSKASGPKPPGQNDSNLLERPNPRSHQGLTVVQAGELVAQERIIELKTRAQGRPGRIQECMPQLWFSGTQHLYIGFHQNGTIVSVTKHVMDENTFSAWEQTHKKDLSKLADLLKKIVETAKGVSGRTCVKCVKGKLVLDEWHETRSSPVQKLPDYLKLRWQVQPGTTV